MAAPTAAKSVLERVTSVLPSSVRQYVLLVPSLAFIGVFFLVPLSLLLVYSFYINPQGSGLYQPGFTLDSYIRFFSSGFYLGKLLLTIEFGLVVTAITTVLGYPLAYYLARTTSRKRSAIVLLLLSTLYVTYIIRAYAWGVILAENGIVNRVLTVLGVSPLDIYPGFWSVVAGLVYSFYPFFVLTLYSSIRSIPTELEEASQNLGASRVRTFRRVVLPLSKNGLLAGAGLVFVLTVGSYVNPVVLGSPSEWFLPVLIQEQVQKQFNVPLASVMSIVMLVVVASILIVTAKLVNVREVAR
jgi:ABC-type spermidine/putrescine transport system permease subunit I